MSGAELMCVIRLASESGYFFAECQLIELATGKILKTEKTKRDNFSVTGIHHLNCFDYPQDMHRTSRSRFTTRFKKRTYTSKDNRRSCNYEQHLLNGNPNYGNIETKRIYCTLQSKTHEHSRKIIHL
jgi:hypothetical protein